MDVKNAVLKGYSDRIAAAGGAMGAEAAQVCRMNAYDPALLQHVPEEIIARDYGCGNPSRFARAGDVVLDPGSGSGKICYILSQIVGPGGQVIGVDMNRDMLALSRAHQENFAARMGYANLRFALGSIDDLASDLERVEQLVSGRRLDSLEDYSALQDSLRGLRRTDPELWAGGYSGVYQEQAFYRALRAAGFSGLTIGERREVPEKTIGEVAFQSVTVTAFKPLPGSQDSEAAAVIYKGPWASVTDDSGTSLPRGEIMQVDSGTAAQLRHSAFAGHLHFLDGQPPQPSGGCCG